MKTDKEDVRRQAAGHWRAIIAGVCGWSFEVLDEKSHPCPMCGGVDRFSATRDHDRHGRVHCRGCIPTCKDGFETVMKGRGVGFPEAVRLVAEFLNIVPADRNGHAANGNGSHTNGHQQPVSDAAARDRTYRAILESLPLAIDHRAQLIKRGLTNEAIGSAGYGTLPPANSEARRKAFDAAKVAAGDDWENVPGINTLWKNSLGRGILIPCRDTDGNIVGMRIRPDDPKGGAKYKWLSDGTPTHPSVAHVPGIDVSKGDTVRVTEGELKADASTLLSGVLTLSCPGVSSWRAILDPLKALDAKSVRLAFDADCKVNLAVARALIHSFDELSHLGYHVAVERWDDQQKGIDDALLAGVEIEVLVGDEAEAYVLDVARSAGVEVDHVRKASTKRNGSSHRFDQPHHGDDMDRFEGQEPPVNGKEVDYDEPGAPKPNKKRRRRLVESEPFPVDTLPDPMRSYVVNHAESLGCCPSLVALPMLSGFAACIGNTRVLQVKAGWFAKAILWTCSVAESGSLKSPAFDAGMAPFRKADDAMEEAFEKEYERYLAELEEWEKALRVKGGPDPGEKPKPPRHPCLLIDDATNEAVIDKLRDTPRGLLMEKDELAAFIGGMDKYAGANSKAGAEAARWLSMYNAGRIKVNRKTGFPKVIRVPRASLSITGGIQPSTLRDMMDKTNRSNGFMARWLFTYPAQQPKKWREHTGGDWLSSVHVQNVVNCLLADLQMDRTDSGEMVPQKIDLSREARAEYAKFYNIHGEEHAQLTGDAAAMSAKLEEIPCRLALILYCIKWALVTDPDAAMGDVDVETMRDAIRLAQWFKQEAGRILGTVRESDEVFTQRKLAEWVKSRGGTVTARTLSENLQAYKNDPDAADSALRDLDRGGFGTYHPPTTSPKGGKPTRVFELHTMRPQPAYPENPKEDEVSGARAQEDFSKPEPIGREWEYQPDEPYGEFR